MKISVRIYRIMARLILVLATLIFICAMAFLGLQLIGKYKLNNRSQGAIPMLHVSAMTDVETDGSGWQEGDVRYQGVHYRYNNDIMTFLFLGIDEMGEVKRREEGNKGGQSDAIFLLVLNPHTKEISVIAVNRNTMTDLEVCNEDASVWETIKAQLCLQHAYGDGAEKSCERSVEAVSKLFYELPINGYCAINMGAIPLINDAVGGVEITALENVIQTDIKEGDTLLLKGMDAYYYLHNRDIYGTFTADKRLERQKQYLTAYAKTAVEAVKADLTLPVTLFNTLSKYMVTDITVDEVSYLATQALGYSFDGDHMYSLKGESQMNGERAEFYYDEEALYELILEVFYERVE